MESKKMNKISSYITFIVILLGIIPCLCLIFLVQNINFKHNHLQDEIKTNYKTLKETNKNLKEITLEKTSCNYEKLKNILEQNEKYFETNEQQNQENFNKIIEKIRNLGNILNLLHWDIN